ncbi:hypothetical protein QTP88_006309 [Uroleucon formosanum]
MPKIPNSILASIRKWIEPYNTSVKAEKKFQIDQHAKSFLHEKCLNKSSKQTFVHEASTSIENQSQFFKELCNTLISSNIPSHKIQNKNFKSFSVKHTKSIYLQMKEKTIYINVTQTFYKIFENS